MICPQCGTENPPGFLFCGRCGAALPQAGTNAPETPAQPQRPDQPAVPVQPAVAAPPATTPEAEPTTVTPDAQPVSAAPEDQPTTLMGDMAPTTEVPPAPVAQAASPTPAEPAATAPKPPSEWAPVRPSAPASPQGQPVAPTQAMPVAQASPQPPYQPVSGGPTPPVPGGLTPPVPGAPVPPTNSAGQPAGPVEVGRPGKSHAPLIAGIVAAVAVVLAIIFVPKALSGGDTPSEPAVSGTSDPAAPGTAEPTAGLDESLELGGMTFRYPSSWDDADVDDDAFTIDPDFTGTVIGGVTYEVPMAYDDVTEDFKDSVQAFYNNNRDDFPGAWTLSDDYAVDISRCQDSKGEVRALVPCEGTIELDGSDRAAVRGYVFASSYYYGDGTSDVYDVLFLVSDDEYDDQQALMEQVLAAIEVKAVDDRGTGTSSGGSSAESSPQAALDQAQSYLSFTHFSHDGLIDQLVFEGYTTEDATYAADNCGADWNEQALGSAKDYLDAMGMSHDGLVDQLVFDKFTEEQATYAVDNCGADWNQEAVDAAQDYLKYMGGSRDQIVEQMVSYDGFTQEQAERGVSQVM